MGCGGKQDLCDKYTKCTELERAGDAGPHIKLSPTERQRHFLISSYTSISPKVKNLRKMEHESIHPDSKKTKCISPALFQGLCTSWLVHMH